MLTLFRLVRMKTPRCTRCGSLDYYPDPGPLRPLLALVRLERYGCRSCRQAFWLPQRLRAEPQLPEVGDAVVAAADAGQDREWPDLAAMDAVLAQSAAPQAATETGGASLAALDRPAAPARPEVRDLAGLDAAVARARRGASSRRPAPRGAAARPRGPAG